MTERTIILHYHLFKNAGTSVDQMLKSHFGEAWVTAEFDMKGNNNTAEVEDWIRNTPDAIAYSSHTMVGPLPQVEGVTVIPIMLLRNPLARIASAYRFERKQEADTWGAQLAKEHDFEGYVLARLARPNDRQCSDFQVSRLATLCRDTRQELTRAKDGLKQIHDLGVFGRVEAFDDFSTDLIETIKPHYPGFQPEITKANISKKEGSAQSQVLTALLNKANSQDLDLLDYARQILKR